MGGQGPSRSGTADPSSLRRGQHRGRLFALPGSPAGSLLGLDRGSCAKPLGYGALDLAPKLQGPSGPLASEVVKHKHSEGTGFGGAFSLVTTNLRVGRRPPSNRGEPRRETAR